MFSSRAAVRPAGVSAQTCLRRRATNRSSGTTRRGASSRARAGDGVVRRDAVLTLASGAEDAFACRSRALGPRGERLEIHAVGRRGAGSSRRPRTATATCGRARAHARPRGSSHTHTHARASTPKSAPQDEEVFACDGEAFEESLDPSCPGAFDSAEFDDEDGESALCTPEATRTRLLSSADPLRPRPQESSRGRPPPTRPTRGSRRTAAPRRPRLTATSTSSRRMGGRPGVRVRPVMPGHVRRRRRRRGGRSSAVADAPPRVVATPCVARAFDWARSDRGRATTRRPACGPGSRARPGRPRSESPASAARPHRGMGPWSAAHVLNGSSAARRRFTALYLRFYLLVGNHTCIGGDDSECHPR